MLVSTANKIAGFERASRFYQELCDVTESFSGIAEQFGERTLCDVIYLQHAVLSGGRIDLWPGESRILDVVDLLKSAAEWRDFITMPENPNHPEAAACEHWVDAGVMKRNRSASANG